MARSQTLQTAMKRECHEITVYKTMKDSPNQMVQISSLTVKKMLVEKRRASADLHAAVEEF